MQQRTTAVLSAALFVAISVACQKSAPLSPTTPTATTIIPADGSTLKATAPTPQSPINDFRLESFFDTPTLTAGASTPTEGGSITPQYRFQLFNEAGVVIEEAVLSSPSWTPTATLEFDKRYSWQVRAEFQGDNSAWSAKASFLSANGGFIRGNEMFDPLTNGKTVGMQHGGTFDAGLGWRAVTDFDGIDYDIAPCPTCTLEFDVTNFNEGEGGNRQKDVKWISMGDAGAFDDFILFRNHAWKMHLEQRGDGNGTGMKLIWRNGDAGDGEPGDHTQRNDSTEDWNENIVYRFILTWSPQEFKIWVSTVDKVTGKENRARRLWFQDGFGGHAYLPPTHRISLGTRSRGETMAIARWSNVKVYPGGPR